MIVHQYHLDFIIILLKLYQSNRLHHIIASITEMIHKLTRKILKLNRPGDDNAKENISIEVLTIAGFRVEQWVPLTEHFLTFETLLLEHLTVLKYKLKYRIRRHQFNLVGKFRKENERRRQLREFKPVLNYLFEKSRSSIEEIRQVDGSIIGDPVTIHDYLTTQLEEHHSLNT